MDPRGEILQTASEPVRYAGYARYASYAWYAWYAWYAGFEERGVAGQPHFGPNFSAIASDCATPVKSLSDMPPSLCVLQVTRTRL